MIDFNQVDAAFNLDKEFILSKVSEEQLLFYYHGHFVLGKAYPSKLRKDGHPSASFYIGRNGKIMYYDFATGERYNCFEFVGKLLHLSFGDSLIRIASDFGIIDNKIIKPLAKSIIDQGVKFDREIKKDTLIQFVPGQWTEKRLLYWGQYSLYLDDLKRAEIYPVDRLFINKNEIRNLDHLCFAYIIKDKKTKKIMVKIYSPYSESMKWITNIPLTVPFGLETLKYSTDHLIITKAKKDMEVLLKLFPSVIGTQNENPSSLPDKLVKHLCHNFPRRTIIWDADETGVNNCKLFNSRGFGYFNTPKELMEQGIKDVSDYVKAFGLKALEALLKQKGIL